MRTLLGIAFLGLLVFTAPVSAGEIIRMQRSGGPDTYVISYRIGLTAFALTVDCRTGEYVAPATIEKELINRIITEACLKAATEKETSKD